VKQMNPIIEIGLPKLQDQDIEDLAEACEQEVSEFIMNMLPPKSVEDLSVSCILDLNELLNIDFEIAISQLYDTGHNLDDVISQSIDHGTKWLEARLTEMKSD